MKVTKINKPGDFLLAFKKKPKMGIAEYLIFDFYKRFGEDVKEGTKKNMGKWISRKKQLEIIAEILVQRNKKYKKSNFRETICSFLQDMYPLTYNFSIDSNYNIRTTYVSNNPYNLTIQDENILRKKYQNWWYNKIKVAPEGYTKEELKLGNSSHADIQQAKENAKEFVKHKIFIASAFNWVPSIEIASKEIDTYLSFDFKKYKILNNIDRIQHNLILSTQKKAKKWMEEEINKVKKLKKKNE